MHFWFTSTPDLVAVAHYLIPLALEHLPVLKASLLLQFPGMLPVPQQSGSPLFSAD